jgi:type VI secretion system protein ImpA
MSAEVATTSAPTATPPVIDLDAMLAPIPGENPAGESLKYTGVYDEIREARRADDLLEQGDWKREPKAADWDRAAEISIDALTTKTKDLQICAWMSEALVKLHGADGLRDSLKVMLGFHRQFWDKVYPENDEGDLEGRANALSWVDRQAAVALKEVALTKGVGYNYHDWESSSSFNVGPDVPPEQAEERRARAAEEGKITSDDWLKAKHATPRAFYESLYASLTDAWDTFRALDQLTGDLYGNQAPSMGELKTSIDQVRTVVEKIVKEKRALEPDASDAQAAGDGAGASAADGNGHASGGAATISVTGPIRSRAEALSRLSEVASFFRQTEPHSPVAYLVERAMKWCQMPLDAWLASVIKDPAVLDSIRETLGVEGAGGETGGE